MGFRGDFSGNFAAPRRPQPVEIDHRAKVQDMRPIDAVEYLLDVIEAIIVPARVDAFWEIDGVKLTRSEKKLLRCIADAGGLVVTKDELYDALVADRAEENWPDIGTVDVHLTHLRKALRDQPFQIVTVWGYGVRMVAQKGYRWPWQVPA